MSLIKGVWVADLYRSGLPQSHPSDNVAVFDRPDNWSSIKKSTSFEYRNPAAPPIFHAVMASSSVLRGRG